MTAGMRCTLRSPGAPTPPAGRDPPPTPAEPATKPPRAAGQRRKRVNPPPGCSGSQHTPAAPLGAVGPHHSGQTGKNTRCRQPCCVSVTYGVSTRPRLQARSEPPTPSPGSLADARQRISLLPGCSQGWGLSTAPHPTRCLGFRQGFPSRGSHGGGLERGRCSRRRPPTDAQQLSCGGD